MATRLLYLEKFDVTEADATVTKVYEGEDDRQVVELDQTCFYPRGGGQDWDTGRITSDNSVFDVEMVRLDENGVVQHYGKFSSGSFDECEQVHCVADEKRRRDNTRLHSAGHLLDMAVEMLALSWVPGKGAHYPHMSFVEYDTGEIIADDSTQQAIQDNVNKLLAEGNYENKIMFVPVAEMGKYCRHVPGNIPANKPARIVLYADDFGIPCGGTHVQRVGDIGQIEITKVKSKKGITKVSYRVNGVN